jgi:hypothetical protein
MNRMTYLNDEVEKLIEKMNTPELLARFSEGISKHLDACYGQKLGQLRLRGSCTKIASYAYTYESPSGDNPQFVIQLVGPTGYAYINLLSFSLADYPHCCGMRQLNGFSTTLDYGSHNILTQGEMETLVDGLINIYRTNGDYKCTRIIMNMVEYRSLKDRRNELAEVLPIDEPSMAYPAFWKWAHKQQRVRDMLMVNGNSGNILHHMEIILNK